MTFKNQIEELAKYQKLINSNIQQSINILSNHNPELSSELLKIQNKIKKAKNTSEIELICVNLTQLLKTV